MAKTTKTFSNRLTIESTLAKLPGPAHPKGLPAKDSIVSMTTSGAGNFTIIHTNEVDAYEEAAKGPSFLAAAAAKLPAGDDFAGTARKAAKLSISAAKTEKFKDVKALIESLVADAKMIAHKPKIGTGATSNRVKEEERNIHVTAFMYAASREADNDFHLIIGRDPTASPEMYMTMELSGLPPKTSPAFAQLKATRDAFKKFFQGIPGGKLPGLAYDFYQPPIPVQIDGSLFFDMTHATGQHPGPPSLKSRMPVIWEVHPITDIVLKNHEKARRMSARTKSKTKQPSGKRRAGKASASPPLDPLRTGMPALDSITGVEVFGKGEKTFQIIHTNEVDAYEKPRAKPKRKKP